MPEMPEMAFDAEQTRNAQTIISVGRSLGASDRDIQIALMTSIVESGLRNVSYGDRDSVGLFQQRAPWGSFETRMDPKQSARMFFTGGQTGQPGLFSKTSRDQMSMGRVAQAVQVSAFPDRYAEHEAEAKGLLGATSAPTGTATAPARPAAVPGTLEKPAGLEGPVDPSAGLDAAPDPAGELDVSKFGVRTYEMDESQSSPIDAITNDPLSLEDFTSMLGGMKLPGVFEHNDVGPVATSGGRKKAVDFALSVLGQPYVWGGQSRTGMDCSGLTLQALAQAGVDIPRVSYAQAGYGGRVGLDKLKPGDLVAWDNSSRNDGADHIAIYIGGGEIVEAPRPGVNVRRRKLDQGEDAWGVDMSEAYGG